MLDINLIKFGTSLIKLFYVLAKTCNVISENARNGKTGASIYFEFNKRFEVTDW